jgi:transposase
MYKDEYRKAVLLLYNYFGSMRKTSKILKVSPSTICRWSKQSTNTEKGWPKRGSKFTDAMIQYITVLLKEYPLYSASYLKNQIYKVFEVEVSRQLVALVLKTRMGPKAYTWKRIRKRGPKGKRWTDEQLEEFKTKYMKAYNSGMLSSWDESSFDQRTHAIYGYAPAGERAILNVPKCSCPHKHYSLLLGIHMNGSSHSIVLSGSVKATHFADFISTAPFPPGTVVLLDNHSLHKTVLVRQAAARKKYTLLFNPPYSPEFNPIEMVFGTTKNAFYKLRYTEEFGNDMESCIERCLDCVTMSGITGCCRHVSKIIDGTARRM